MCNAIGQNLGFIIGRNAFLTLQSKEFANKWIRETPLDKGLVEIDGNLPIL
jgi:hypothetical protein